MSQNGQTHFKNLVSFLSASFFEFDHFGILYITGLKDMVYYICQMYFSLFNQKVKHSEFII